MHHPTDRIAHTTAFVTPVVEHCLEREIAQWVHSLKDRSDDPSHHERTLLPRSYISLSMAWGELRTFLQAPCVTWNSASTHLFLIPDSHKQNENFSQALFRPNHDGSKLRQTSKGSAGLRRCGAKLRTISVGPGSQSTCTKVCTCMYLTSLE